MTRAQNMIVNYINQQFVPGSVTIIPVGESHVKITDKNKESLTFTVNIFGDMSATFSAMSQIDKNEYDELLRTVEAWAKDSRKALDSVLVDSEVL